tara:strand:- start:5661 stop:6011 length:351 start_codon:yes stop_codon:yes gene_type:complete
MENFKSFNEGKDNKKYKNFKLFDCQHMPDDIRKIFFKGDKWQHTKGHNDIIVNYYVYAETYDPIKDDYVDVRDGELLYTDDENPNLKIIRGNDVVSDWLFDNGGELFEEVLIKHWW